MPRQRKQMYRKRRNVRRRPRRAAARRATRRVNTRGDTHFFKRMLYKTTITPVPGDVNYGALSFQFNDMPASTEFTNLFDYYKLTGVKLRFALKLDPSAQTAANAQYPVMYSAIDYDDITAPFNADELRERQWCRQTFLRPNSYKTFYIKPRVTRTIFNGANLANPGYETSRAGWLDMAYPAIPHYGFKWAIENLIASAGQSIRVEATYYFAVKGTR